MKKKLASVLCNMNYELAIYSCANQLIKSPALMLIMGVAKCTQLVLVLQPCTSNNTVSVVSWADSRQLKVCYSWHIQCYLWLSHS